MRSVSLALAVVMLIAATVLAGDMKSARDVLTRAHIEHVVGKSSGPVSCNYKTSDAKTYMACEYTSGGFPKKSLWEVEDQRGKFHFYAVNGTAITAMDSLKGYAEFSKHPSPHLIDIPYVLDAIAGKAQPGRPASTNVPKSGNDQEHQQWCLYMKAKDQLTIEANKRFSDPISEARRQWVEPQILAIRKKYFTEVGLKYEDVSAKALDDRWVCQ